MSRRAEEQAGEPTSTSEAEMVHPRNHENIDEEPPEMVSLGEGSRFSLIEEGRAPPTLLPQRGLLPVPPEVEAEVKRQEAKHPMTREYRKTLRDRLTLEHYFSDVEVAFRRTPAGIEVVAVGLAEVAEFRRTSTREERQGIVYGVG